jgi:hypothetical protein
VTFAMSSTSHPEVTAPNAVPRVSPFCMHLLSKNIVKRARPMLVDEDVLDASNHCWCAGTGQILGPDRFVAHPHECRRGRACFESPLSDLT